MASSLCIVSVISSIVALVSGSVTVSRQTCGYNHDIGRDSLEFVYQGLGIPARCTFKVTRESTRYGNLLCIKRAVYVDDCKTTVSIHLDSYKRFPEKVFSCHAYMTVEYCVSASTVIMEFKNAPGKRSSSTNIKLEVYLKHRPTASPLTPIGKAPENDSSGVVIVIVSVATAALLFVLVIVLVILVRRHRQRRMLQETTGGVICFNAEPSATTDPSNTAASNTVPHAQPLLADRTTHKPPAGYHPPSTYCYPPPVEQAGNQPFPRPENTRTEYQTDTHGNQPPRSDISQDTHPTPSAPPAEADNDVDDDPPPPYPGY